jgi:nitroreductase
MDFFDAVKTRRSIRAYTGERIPKDDLLMIIDAGRLAASGHNRQAWTFVIITEKDTIDQISRWMNPWIAKAGAVIALVMDPSAPFWLQDGSAATENILLAATALGYGSCWLEGTTQRVEEELKQLLGVPANLRIQTLITLGVPAEQPSREKKSLEEVTRWERFSEEN